MKIIADLQIHSPYARAVSKNMTIENIALWASKKGINLVTPGDWTHPVRYKEIRELLVENSEGIYNLRSKFKSQNSKLSGIKFLLVTEVECQFRLDGKYHAVHILVFAPSLEVVEKINKELIRRGWDKNLRDDGRPKLPISCRDLASLILDIDPNCLLIPAHSWTPWFGFYGAHGGFDSLDEAFGNYAKCIYAVETGLGSDPAMNWRIRELDNCNIVSFSDAHSLSKIGREATVFEVGDARREIRYEDIRRAITSRDVILNESEGSSSGKDSSPKAQNDICKISYTLEFYSQEGKYHFTGHRKCGTSFSPQDTPKDYKCPVCGKKLTVGAAQRTEDLAYREERTAYRYDENSIRWVYSLNQPGRPPFVNLVPLQEILSEVYKVGVGSKKIQNEYERLVTSFAPEFEILLEKSLREIQDASGEKLKEAIGKVRGGEVQVIPGFDGKFGEVKIDLPEKQSVVAQTKQLGLL